MRAWKIGKTCFIIGKLLIYSLFNFIRQNLHFILIANGLFLLTFLVLLPLLCHDWAFSKYYSAPKQAMTAKAHQVNEHRWIKADAYLGAIDWNATKRHYEKLMQKKDVDLAIGVVTVRRTSPKSELKYLTQVMTELDKLILSDGVFQSKVMFMCNVYHGQHEEAEMLSQIYPMVKKYANETSLATQESLPGVVINIFEREKNDYVFCLNHGLSFTPKYILLIEDDTLPHSDLFPVLSNILKNRIENELQPNGECKHRTDQWAYIKLYYPEKWQGLSKEVIGIFELIGIGCLGGSISRLLYMCFSRRRQQYITQLLAFAVGVAYVVMIFIFVGRQYFLQWRRLSPYLYKVIEAPDCCTPAVLYPQQMARELDTFLNSQNCTGSFPLDFAIDRFVKNTGYRRYLVEPNLMKHIGMVSSVKSHVKEPQQFL